jgi:hypothetical protein
VASAVWWQCGGSVEAVVRALYKNPFFCFGCLLVLDYYTRINNNTTTIITIIITIMITYVVRTRERKGDAYTKQKREPKLLRVVPDPPLGASSSKD